MMKKNEENDPFKLFDQILSNIYKKLKPYGCSIKFENIKTKGLLFKVPIQGKETLFPVIIIALHPFKNKSIKNKEIKIFYNNTEYIINIDDSRTFYSNDEYDIIFIEIKEYDDLYKYDFLELNIDLFKEEKELFNRNISLPQTTFEIAFSYTFGYIISPEIGSFENGINLIKNLLYKKNLLENKSIENENNIGKCIEKTLERFYKKIKDIQINNKMNLSYYNNYKESSKEKMNNTLKRSKDTFFRYLGMNLSDLNSNEGRSLHLSVSSINKYKEEISSYTIYEKILYNLENSGNDYSYSTDNNYSFGSSDIFSY